MTRLGDRFSEVYARGLWQTDETASGLGSERASGQVAHALTLLDRFTRQYDIRSIADLPCGDFNWMPAYLKAHPQVAYVGYDVVPALIEANRSRFPERRFDLLDVTEAVPERADLLFCKDLLNHLSEADIWTALANMIGSGATYLLLTTNRGFANMDLEADVPHASRFLNLQASPYDLPPPLFGDHYFLLWRGNDLKAWLDKGLKLSASKAE